MKNLLIFGTLILCFFGQSQVVINEYSCSNLNGPLDSFGENEDWAELFNTSSTTLDLTGYYLSDKASNPLKWQIPSGSIAANGYKMIYFSKRGLVAGNEIHPDFSLNQTKGEYIILSNALGNIVDSLKIRHKTKANHSYGRASNGAATWKLFLVPTPGLPNLGGVDYYLPKPTINLAPGFYSNAVTIYMFSSQVGTTIRYTLDGSEVTPLSPIYTAPIVVGATTVVKAANFSLGREKSFTETNTYFIGVNHTIPVVSISGTPVFDLIAGGIGPTLQHIGYFELFETDKVLKDEGAGHFNKHGNDSWAYAQRGFDFIMRDQLGYNDEVHHKIFPEKDREDFQRLILKPAANDNFSFENGAHIRDAFVHTLAQKADLKLDARTWRPCILYINGQYWGVYEIREKVDDHDYTEFYYDQDKFNLQYAKTWGVTWSEYGGTATITDWNSFKAFVQNNSMATPANFELVDSVFNWKSLVDYFVLNSYVVSQDWLNWNTAWWRGMNPSGDKKKWRYTLWDMDATFGHYINYTGIPDPTANADPCNVENLPNPGGQGHTDILKKLIDENPVVKQYYITRYVDLVNTYFSCDYMNSLLDSMIDKIKPEMIGQVAKWGGTYTGWLDAVQELRDFIDLRCMALQAGMKECYSLTGPYAVTFRVEPSGAGEIKVNSTWMPTEPWITTYFGGIETLLEAKEKAGYEFDYWEISAGTLDSLPESKINSTSLIGNEVVTAVFRPIDDPENPGANTKEGFGLPTAFSPNGDGRNDIYRALVGKDVLNFELFIYDRWGTKVFYTDDAKVFWDGTYKGELLPTGVYVYMAEVWFKDNRLENYSGNLTLLR